MAEGQLHGGLGHRCMLSCCDTLGATGIVLRRTPAYFVHTRRQAVLMTSIQDQQSRRGDLTFNLVSQAMLVLPFSETI